MPSYDKLLITLAFSGTASSSAMAQAVLSSALVGSDLRGAGSSAVEHVVVQAFNCISGNANAQQLGRGAPAHATLRIFGISRDTNSTPIANATQGGSLATIPNGVSTATPSTDRCASPIQPNFKSRYVSTGSGFGRSIWSNFSNRFSSGGFTGQSNPFEITDDATSGWNNVQFAFSVGSISLSDLNTYNITANNAANKAGRAIQIPLYVLPIALAYSRKYGELEDGTPLFFTVADGGIKLNQAQYCGIFNGTIKNFNQLPSASVNGSPADIPGRYHGFGEGSGVPIRLVGRFDISGTTDIFTRHLTAVCGAGPFHPGTGFGNKFVGNSGLLPVTAIAFGATYNNGVLTGTEVLGLFARATGDNGVRDAIAAAPDVATPSGVKLNGRFGYISASFVSPATGAILDAAQLTQVGSTTAFRAPNARNASAAFATILPPQSTASSGAYNPTGDLRRNAFGLGGFVNRANPLDWADVLYSRADTSGGFTARTLAAPPLGYPITGVSFMLTSTCFKSTANRLAIAEFLYANVKKLRYDNAINGSGPANVSVNLFSGELGTGTARGLTAQGNVAPMPLSWQRAIFDTFLTKKLGALGARGLWIQSKQPTTTLTGITSNTGGTDSNVGGVVGAGCTSGEGA